MISASNILQPSIIWAQEYKYIQLIFLQKFSLLISDIYPIFYLLNCNQMNILLPFSWKYLVLPHKQCQKKFIFGCFIDASVIKTIPVMI